MNSLAFDDGVNTNFATLVMGTSNAEVTITREHSDVAMGTYLRITRV